MPPCAACWRTTRASHRGSNCTNTPSATGTDGFQWAWADGETDTSTSGLGGSEFTATAITLEQFLADHPPGRMSLVKIDIEGAEALLAKDLFLLAGQPVHLSMHVPLFPERADVPALVGALSRFDAFDDRGQHLEAGELAERITAHASHPPWGSRHGNYFEVLLVPR